MCHGSNVYINDQLKHSFGYVNLHKTVFKLIKTVLSNHNIIILFSGLLVDSASQSAKRIIVEMFGYNFKHALSVFSNRFSCLRKQWLKYLFFISQVLEDWVNFEIICDKFKNIYADLKRADLKWQLCEGSVLVAQVQLVLSILQRKIHMKFWFCIRWK